MKTIKHTFSDRYATQVVFHAKKKAPKAVGSLRQLAALSASNSLRSIGEATYLAEEGLLPGKLVQDLEAAWTNCWTKRYARARLYSCCTMIHPTQCV